MASFLKRRKHERGGGVEASPGAEDRWISRHDAAFRTVERILLRSEESFPAGEDMTLGTWFARAQETLAVTSRVCIGHIESGQLLGDRRIADEVMVAFGEVCSEATRTVGWLNGGERARANQAALQLLWHYDLPIADPAWAEVLEAVARCSAALEPVANCLREGDVAREDARSVDGDVIKQAWLEVGRLSFREVYALCG